jgi:hypothetical protein
MQFHRLKTIAALGVLISMMVSSPVMANNDTPVRVHEGIWIESPILVMTNQGVLEAYLVINNRTDRDLTVSSINAPDLGSVQVVNAAGSDMSSTLRVPHHSELYMQPGGVRIQISPPANAALLEPVRLILGIGPYDPVAIELEYLKPGTPLPDHHDYKHCDSC